MRFLVDENLPLGIIKYLTSLKHDVIDVADSDLRGSPDKILWAKAAEEKRIIVTRDLDFPIPRLKPAPFAVVLVRVPSDFTASQITEIFRESMQRVKVEALKNKIAVIAPGRIRISPLP